MKKLLFVLLLLTAFSLTACESQIQSPEGQDEILFEENDQVILKIRNLAAGKICYVYVVPTSFSGWGQDQLGASEIRSTSYFEFGEFATGRYNLRAEDCDGNYVQRFNVLLGDGRTIWQLYQLTAP